QFTEYASGDPLCRGLSGKIPIHVSHSQSVLRLPENARILAANAFEPHQAVRFADSVWGVQFHPEFDADIMRAYIRERKQALTAEGLAADDLYQQVRDTHEAASILTNFAELITSYEPD
ncbi:MAG: glutamine amidotransferase, partial [Pseudohongiellaceae bacterium]